MTSYLSGSLKDAIRMNQPDLIESSMTKGPINMGTRQKELDACLELSMPTGTLEVIERLLTLGARLVPDSLFAAVARQEPEVFQLLIEFGWDINSTRFSHAAIHHAVDHEVSLRWLLEHGADPNLSSERREIGSCLQRATPLDYASKLSDPTSVNILLSHGANLDPDAIYHAIGIRYQKNGTATLKALIDHGADVNYNSKRWSTPLFHTVRIGSPEKLRLLLERGADPEIKSLNTHTSPLELAKKDGRMDMYELMEEAYRQKFPDESCIDSY
ncbi:hypothetical protein HBI70_178240 [Parastagonospora nodorum]|nr:hypothetical protein HBI10_172740 [Parastagonospora nodorum]KAH4016154.1 hypothetical protein HBI13_154020 [Parastagonospora nodorum]KAH5087171.1 hypothetical protein HBI73_150400 [Parastagonospora nodorum]KAH5186352.1 hypothetical protein HBH68_166710 [Parastagonospora nodorum]KAH5212743.1 hypothetical protein HBI62_192720 [Parastagonospora nodorum]